MFDADQPDLNPNALICRDALLLIEKQGSSGIGFKTARDQHLSRAVA
jgi:hypothetical protein